MSLSALIYFYRRRLRSHPVQELLAGAGIAVGVALVFAVQVANSSVNSGSRTAVRTIMGAANLQLLARSPDGMPEATVARLRALPGVQAAGGVIDLDAVVRGRDGRQATVQLMSASATLAPLAGLARRPSVLSVSPYAMLLPRALASKLGVSTRLGVGIPAAPPLVSVRVRGRAAPVAVAAVLGPEIAGPLSSVLAALMPLSTIQRLASMPGRVSAVLVEARAGALARVRHELQGFAAGRYAVAPTDLDVRLLEQATAPSAAATGFFAFVSGLVGTLLAFNAMLLSTPERRRVIADLRIQGTKSRDLVKLMLFQSLCLGVVASLVGVVVGDVLSHGLFRESPGYLAAAFPLAAQTVVGWQPLVLAVVGGVGATCLAAAPPLLDLRRSQAVDAVYFEAGEPGQTIGPGMRRRLLALAGVVLAVSVATPILFGPSAGVGAIVGLALAALLAIPFGFTTVVRLAQLAAARARRWNMLLMATRTLRATTASSLALAATGAIAVFGAVAAEGAHRNLLDGLYRDYGEYVSTASMWVTNPRDYLATNSFPAARLPERIAGVGGVAEVRPYQGGFIDVAGRRAWVLARSPHVGALFPPGQLVAGDARAASADIRAGGWVAVSQQLADALHAHVGGPITLPTATGARTFRLAATTSNLGWTGGAIVLNDADWQRWWQTLDPTALEVDVRPGADVAAVKAAIERQLGPTSALQVETSAARASRADALAREGLSRLTQIALLLMVAATLAMAAAMGASVWQRRPSLASLRIQSFRPAQLRVILLLEAALILATGSLAGALAGIYGQALIDRYLRLVSGFPAPFSPSGTHTLLIVATIMGAALFVLAVPGFAASRAPARLALEEQA